MVAQPSYQFNKYQQHYNHYINNSIKFVMKKTKPQKITTVPISLSAKKTGVLKHEMLFTPYKIEWKNVQPQSISQTSSRTFFTSMKNELSNFKSDIQKMIKKQSQKGEAKPVKSGVLEQNIGAKNDSVQKSYSSLNKLRNSIEQSDDTGRFEDKVVNEQCSSQEVNTEQKINNSAQINKIQKELLQKQLQIESLAKQNRLQKNLITQLKKQNQQLYIEMDEKSKTVQNLHLQFEIQKSNRKAEIENLSSQVYKLQANLTQLQKDNFALRSKNNQLSTILKKIQNSHELQKQQMKRKNDELRIHNSFLQQKIEGLSEKMGIVSSRFKQKQLQVKQLQLKIQLQRNKKLEKEHIPENQFLIIQRQFNKKMELKERQLKQIFEYETKKLKQSFLAKIRQTQDENQQIIQQIETQKQKLKLKIRKLQQQMIHKQPLDKSNRIDFSQLGSEYEKKINELIERNYQLKNKVTALQSEVESSSTQKKGLLQHIQLYEQMQSLKNNQQYNANELEKAIFQIHELKKEKQLVIEEYQFKLIKLQNEIQQLRNKTDRQPVQTLETSTIGVANFNKILKDQLQQNQDLKQKLRQNSRQIGSLQRQIKEQEQKQAVIAEQLAVQKMKADIFEKKCQSQQKQTSFGSAQLVDSLKYDLDLLKKKYEALNLMLDSKNKLIKSKDEFIQRVLISKAGKKQEQEQILYLLRQAKILISQAS